MILVLLIKKNNVLKIMSTYDIIKGNLILPKGKYFSNQETPIIIWR